jgi:hypothetical protein
MASQKEPASLNALFRTAWPAQCRGGQPGPRWPVTAVRQRGRAVEQEIDKYGQAGDHGPAAQRFRYYRKGDGYYPANVT